jgi:2-oxoglutarate ferredoxin oxidoreductase subunit alpha
MRIRAFPFNSDVWDFIDQHESIFIVEQNRDAQMKTLVVAEGGINPDKLVSVLCFDGSPITAKFISGSIIDVLSDKNISKTAEDFK